MVQIVSKREQIVAEIIKRIAAAFPDSTIDRGIPSGQVSNFDHFFVIDLPEACELSSQSRGMYHCAFTISISYWLQISREDLYPAGNILAEKIRLAIEQDEHLNRLVISYSMDEAALIWYDEGVLDVELLFMIEYVKDAGWVSNPFKP